MIARLSVFAICLLTASTATAGPIVMWELIGEVGRSTARGFADPLGWAPPVGTPVAVRFSFDPSATIQQPGHPEPGCVRVSVTGSISVGNITTTSMSGFGFTHGMLPGDTCGGIDTQFALSPVFPQGPTADSPWNLRAAAGPLELWYFDALVRDQFPNSPTPLPDGRAGWQFGANEFSTITLSGAGILRAVEQPTPVPEPGTMTLFGIGLAAVGRRIRRLRK